MRRAANAAGSEGALSSEIPVEAKDIVKRYDHFVAVDGVSLRVKPGIMYGLLGPNGAGKTTTIRMIMNIIAPDSGAVTIFGEPSGERTSRRIGYLPEERGLYRKMKVLDQLAFLGEIRGVDRRVARRRAAQWLERLELGRWASKKVEDLSKGMQQKIQFAGCAIHEPEIFILDEPFSGLDPLNTRVMKELFVELRDQGKTLIFSTHIMEQAEKLCDEIALINRAKIVLEGTMSEVRKRYSGNRLHLVGKGSVDALRKIDGVQSVAGKDDDAEIELAPTSSRGEFLRAATEAWEVESATPHEASLDEIFVEVVGAPVASFEPKEEGR